MPSLRRPGATGRRRGVAPRSVPRLAAQYPAWGDTGWVYASKRDCCDGAVQIAQEYSAQACYDAGGVPRPTTGTRRGVCQWDTQRDAWGRTLFRCQAEAALWCR